MDALELVVPLKQEMLCAESYNLFRTVIATVDPDDWLWRPAELLMVGAFKWQMDPPSVEDSEGLVYFLRRCLSEQEKGVVQDEPIERIMLALGGVAAGEIGGGLAFTEPPFLNGIYYALREDAPYLLRRATVIFFRHLDTQFFDTFRTKQAAELVSRWSTSAKESWDKDLCQVLAEALVTTLMELLDSPFWRDHIPKERWDILRLISGLGGKLPRPLYRCLKNPTIIPYLREMRGRGSGVFTQWLAIMWMKYPDLSEEVGTQLRKATKEIANGPSKNDITTYLSLLDGEIDRDRERVGVYASWSFEEGAVGSRTRHETLLSARGILAGIQKFPYSRDH